MNGFCQMAVSVFDTWIDVDAPHVLFRDAYSSEISAMDGRATEGGDPHRQSVYRPGGRTRQQWNRVGGSSAAERRSS